MQQERAAAEDLKAGVSRVSDDPERDSQPLAEMDSDMLHAMSMMVTAHADLIQSMVMANKAKPDGESVFGDKEMKGVMESGMQFVPQVRPRAPERADGGRESSDGEDPVVVPLFGSAQGSED